jgi:hypothetical protein
MSRVAQSDGSGGQAESIGPQSGFEAPPGNVAAFP